MSELSRGPSPLLETDLIRTFVAISETGSFTRAARQVFRTPSAVSMQVKKLEETLGKPLFLREGRSVSLTPDGEALLSYARRLLRINEEAVSRFLCPPVEGAVSFGAPDDFGTRYVPGVLARFACTHPLVEVNVVLGPSLELAARIDDGSLDLTLLTTCAQGPTEGEIVLNEPLVWTGLKGGIAHEQRPLPLALAAHGCAWRQAALKALDVAGIAYRIAYTSEHCVGQEAALLADLAVAPFPRSLVGDHLAELGLEDGLPDLGTYNVVLRKSPQCGPAAEVLAAHVAESFRR